VTARTVTAVSHFSIKMSSSVKSERGQLLQAAAPTWVNFSGLFFLAAGQ
jgi:hypothetical protein